MKDLTTLKLIGVILHVVIGIGLIVAMLIAAFNGEYPKATFFAVLLLIMEIQDQGKKK